MYDNAALSLCGRVCSALARAWNSGPAPKESDMKLALALGALAVLCVLPVHADSVYSVYDVTGSFTITGNDLCNGPCVETVDFSFILDEIFSPMGSSGYYYLKSQNPLYIASGPLPPISGFGFDPGAGYVGVLFGDAGTLNEDEVDFYAQEMPQEGLPFVPSFYNSVVLYYCGTPGCLPDFCPPEGCGNPFVTGGSLTTIVTPLATPEASSFALLIMGVLGLAVTFHRGVKSLRYSSLGVANRRV